MTSAAERGKVFKALHQRAKAFIMPNPWDAGTAKMLEALGFEALATTSAGHAHSLGRRDNPHEKTLAEALSHARTIIKATNLPVSADLENGYGDAPEAVAETIRLAARAGLAGCSIEDATGHPEAPIYPFALAVERIAAAVEAVRALKLPFVLTARAENFLHGRHDFDDTLKRLVAFAKAGADVIYSPGVKDMGQIRALCQATDKPVNMLASPLFTVAELEAAGVRRISLGSALSRAALGAFLRAAREIREQGTFGFARQAASFDEIEGLFKPTAGE
jgi:2-methylisocitrate lyase-like PEP mutase family enzyme